MFFIVHSSYWMQHFLCKDYPHFLINWDWWWERICKQIFTEFLYKSKIRIYSRLSSKGAVFAQSFNESDRGLLKLSVSGKNNAKWIDKEMKLWKNIILQRFFQLTYQQSKRFWEHEKNIWTSFLDKRNKTKPKCKLGKLVTTADKKFFFLKWRYWLEF